MFEEMGFLINEERDFLSSQTKEKIFWSVVLCKVPALPQSFGLCKQEKIKICEGVIKTIYDIRTNITYSCLY